MAQSSLLQGAWTWIETEVWTILCIIVFWFGLNNAHTEALGGVAVFRAPDLPSTMARPRHSRGCDQG